MSENTAMDTVKSTNKPVDSTTRKTFFKRRKGCPLSLPGAPVVNYKNPELLKKFISEGGRMLPSRITNVCAKKQRQLRNQIKIARVLALLPFVFQTK